MSFYDTTEVIRALEKWLATLTIANPDSPDDTEPLFEVVTKLDTPDLATAVERSIAVTERLVCVVPGQDSYTPIKSNPVTLQREQEFLFILSAADFSPFFQENFFSYGEDADVKVQTGLLKMKDYLISQLFGQPLANLSIEQDDGTTYTANFKCVFVPEGGKSAAFEGDSAAVPEIREGYILAVRVTMGEQQACLARGTRRLRH